MTDRPDLTRFGLELDEELGRGATGIVYRGRQIEVGNRAVAVKVFDPTLAQSVEALGREIEATSSLRHPNVVSVYDGNTASEPSFLVLELAEPRPPQLPIPLSSTLVVGVKLASALAVAHEAGIVHSDVKPDNILWHEGTEPLLGDFGTARVEARTRYRRDAGFTPLWSPPWVPASPADRLSDVWSLAASLIWFHWQWEPPSIHWEQISPDLVDVLRAAMPDRPDPDLLGPEPAAELGRRLQRVQSERGWPITPFPDGRHANWLPADRSRETVLTPSSKAEVVAPRVARPPSSPTSSTGQTAVPTPAPTAIGVDRASASERTRRRWRWKPLAALLITVAVGAAVLSTMPMGERLLGLADSSATDDGEPQAALDGEGVGSNGTVVDATPAAPGIEPEPTASPGTTGSTASTDSATAVSSLTTELVWASDLQGDLDIYHRRPDGSVVPIVDRPIDDYAPSLSPDGTQVAFESNEGGSRAVYIAMIEGSDPPRRVSPLESEAAEPAWSPDGRSLAWASLAQGSWDIVVHDLDTGAERVVVTSASDDRSPAWSPDGTQLVFRSDRTGNGDIYLLSLTDQSLRQITTSPNEEDNPAVSRTGEVAFERRLDADVELFTVDSETETPTRRTIRSGFDGSPTFAGERLVFVRRDSGASQILLDDGTSLSDCALIRGLDAGPHFGLVTRRPTTWLRSGNPIPRGWTGSEPMGFDRATRHRRMLACAPSRGVRRPDEPDSAD